MSIYPYLRPLWAALAVSALVNLASLTDSMTILMIANVINLLCYAVNISASCQNISRKNRYYLSVWIPLLHKLHSSLIAFLIFTAKHWQNDRII